MLQPTLKQMREDATGEYFPITSDDYQEEILENPRAKPNLSDRLKTLKIGGISFAGAAFVDYNGDQKIDNLPLVVCFSSGIVAGRALRNRDRALFYSTLPAVSGSVLYSLYKNPSSAVVNIGAYIITTFGTWLFSPSKNLEQEQLSSEN